MFKNMYDDMHKL